MMRLGRGVGGIFAGESVLGLGDNGKPTGEGQGAPGTGPTEWVMEWGSGEEAVPVQPTASSIGTLLEELATRGTSLIGQTPLAPASSAVQETARQLAVTGQQLLPGRQWIPGIPNVVTGVGAAVGVAGVAYLLLRKKRKK